MAAVSIPEILATTDILLHWRFQSLSPNTPLETSKSAADPIPGILGIYSSYAYANINRCSSLYSFNADFDFHHQCSPVLMRISKVATVSIPVALKFQLIIAIVATGSCLAIQVQSLPKVVSLVFMRPSKWQLRPFQKSLPPLAYFFTGDSNHCHQILLWKHQKVQQTLFQWSLEYIPRMHIQTSTDAAVSIPLTQTSIFTISVLPFLCDYQKLQQSPFQSLWSFNSLLQSSPPAPVWQCRSNFHQKWSLLFLCDHQNGSCVYSRNPCHHWHTSSLENPIVVTKYSSGNIKKCSRPYSRDPCRSEVSTH